MLNDNKRNLAFLEALQQVVSPRDNVIDVGTGTGLLALYAAKARPRQVLACEASTTMAHIAKKITRDTACIQVVNQLSTHIQTEAKFDVLVTETFDAGLLGEHVLETLDHAWKHLLHSKR